ncbi:MAG: TetR/AcrR family transcriptional regulator C-terminal domain-containing protein [Actinobacteria bacterium]|nr:TetR/AcrR family transcriptional regulator C-terminal domain-containing protein [Actinomycetota bacterium]
MRTVKAREKLNRDRIVDAALLIMDREGLEAVTMRRVAREVGVEAMSLYHHVADKDDLLDRLCSRVMTDFRIPEDDDRPWTERARHGAREWRRVLKSHPNVIALFAERTKPMTEVDSLLPMEYALSLIMESGADERAAVQTFNVMGGYIMGFVMMETGQMFTAGALDAQNPDPAAVAPTFPADQLPCIAAALPHLATCDPDEQFEFGLDLLFGGLETRFSGAR